VANKERLKVFSVRLDEDKMHLAKFYGIDTGEIFRKALIEEISKRDGKCPTCGNKTKWEKVK
jgi:DNA repair exonuclease SbcCD ATPase subunit